MLLPGMFCGALRRPVGLATAFDLTDSSDRPCMVCTLPMRGQFLLIGEGSFAQSFRFSFASMTAANGEIAAVAHRGGKYRSGLGEDPCVLLGRLCCCVSLHSIVRPIDDTED